MATINTATTRGSVKASGTDAIGYASWEEIRDFTNGNSVSVNTNDAQAIRAGVATTKIATTWTCYRYFMAFDTSSVTSVPGSATLYVYGNTNATSDLIVVKASSPTTSTNIATTNYSNIVGYTPGSLLPMQGYVTEYSDYIAPGWNITGYNAIPLTAAALSDMDSLTTLKLALVNYTYDYLLTGFLGTTVQTGINITNPPYIEYTGFGGKIYSILLSSVSKVDDISKGSINRINT
jgi:hypothetical protein